jgi:hypothetical protein
MAESPEGLKNRLPGEKKRRSKDLPRISRIKRIDPQSEFLN